MGNPKKTHEMVLKLRKGHEKHFQYSKPQEMVADELFFERVCRKTRDDNGNQVPLTDKQGNQVFYQLQYFIDSEADNLSEDQKKILLEDPRFKDHIKSYKTLPGQ